jgi:hypothetical protein
MGLRHKNKLYPWKNMQKQHLVFDDVLSAF